MKMNLKNTHHYFLILFCFFIFSNISAQSLQLSTSENASFKEKLRGIRLGLFADNGVHPGFKIGTSYVISEKEKSRKYLFKFRQGKKGSQLKIIHYLADSNLGFYNHPNNHLGVFLGLGATRMQTNTAKMRTWGLSVEVNYLRRLYNIPTLQLNDNGEIEEINNAGRNSLMFSFAPSFGKIFGTKNGGNLWHIYAKPNLQLVEYDFGFFPNAAMEIGLTLRLK